jgi:hypothetical protein
MKKVFFAVLLAISLLVDSFGADKYPFPINVNKKSIYINKDGVMKKIGG